jgi:hypothetical protein
MPEPAHELGHCCASLCREHGPVCLRSCQRRSGRPTLSRAEHHRRWRTEAPSRPPVGEVKRIAGGADMIPEMGRDHRDQVGRDRDIADAGGRLGLTHDVALATNTDDATAYIQDARLEIDVFAAQLSKTQSTKHCQRDRQRESGGHGFGKCFDLLQRGRGDLPGPCVCRRP